MAVFNCPFSKPHRFVITLRKIKKSTISLRKINDDFHMRTNKATCLQIWNQSKTYDILWNLAESNLTYIRSVVKHKPIKIKQIAYAIDLLWSPTLKGSVSRILWHLVVKLHVAAEDTSPSPSKHEGGPNVAVVVSKLKRCLVCPFWATVKNMAASVERTFTWCWYKVYKYKKAHSGSKKTTIRSI